MSRFSKLLESANESESEQTQQQAPVVASNRFGGEVHYSITETGPTTEAEYSVLLIPCSQGTCDTPILHIIDPEYDIEVGQTHSIPLELLFTSLEPEIKEDKGELGMWGNHHLASGNYYQFTCPECGAHTNFVLCKDEGILALTGNATSVTVPIPKSRIGYLNRPKNGWVNND